MQRLTVKYIWIAIIVAGPSPTSASALEPVLVREIRPVEGGTSGFAESVDVSGDTVVVGAPDESAADVYVRRIPTLRRQAKLVGNDRASRFSSFGSSVALSGDVAVVGFPGDGRVDIGNIGSAYVFARTGERWSQQAKLFADDGMADDEFGFSVAVSGNSVLIGAPADPFRGSGDGAAYVFTRTESRWIQQARLQVDSSPDYDAFGYSVAISGDIAVIGAYLSDDQGTDSGSAYVFVRSGNTWTQQARLLADDGARFAEFGFAVAVDGDVAVIGNRRNAAYVFTHNGGVWSQQAKLVGDEFSGGFGESVSVFGDVVLIGAEHTRDPDDSLRRIGAAHIFRREGTTWLHQAKLNRDTVPDILGRVGRTVSVHGDIAVIGADDFRAYVVLVDDDSDGDLVGDSRDAFPTDPSEWFDTDSDKVGDNIDEYPNDSREWLDSDSDGTGDNSDAFPNDPTESVDTDGDGVGDNTDLFPNDPKEWLDSDTDGCGDNGDAFPNDPAECVDTDRDGIGNNADPDDDNDGVPDADDAYPLGRYPDSPVGTFAFAFIEALSQAGLEGGCSGTFFCPGMHVTRAEMAVLLQLGMKGSDYVPPLATGNVFLDVGVGDFAADFIEQLFNDGITGGCGDLEYCPTATTTRAQMAVFLLRARHGAGYTPPPPGGMIFRDVNSSYWAAAWIEQLAVEGITNGCSENSFCPEAPVTRAQMAVFLVRAFDL